MKPAPTVADWACRFGVEVQTTPAGGPSPRSDRTIPGMSTFDAFGYDGKRALVVGGATGMGAAADYRADVGVETSTPLEQAYPLVFLCSAAAVAINGQTLISDQGYIDAGITKAFPAAAPVAQFLMGRMG